MWKKISSAVWHAVVAGLGIAVASAPQISPLFPDNKAIQIAGIIAAVLAGGNYLRKAAPDAVLPPMLRSGTSGMLHAPSPGGIDILENDKR